MLNVNITLALAQRSVFPFPFPFKPSRFPVAQCSSTDVDIGCSFLLLRAAPLKRIIHTNAPGHFLTFVVEFEAVSGDGKVTGQPQGEDVACAGDRRGDLEACQPVETEKNVMETLTSSL